jgi:acyl-CoA thioesterase
VPLDRVMLGREELVSFEFDLDTRVERLAAGRYRARLTDRWNALGGRPNGGYVLSASVRALADAMAATDPLAVSAFFLRPAAPGPASISTEVVRTGRRISTGEVRLVQAEREVLRALVSFADLSAPGGRSVLLAAPPELPPVEDAIDLLGGRSIPDVTIVDRYDYRAAAAPGWVHGKPSGDASMMFWLRFRDERPVDTLALVAMVDAAWPAVLELGEAGSSTVELTVHIRARPQPGWLACRVRTRYVIGGYHEEDFEIWDRDGHLVAQSRQLALLA